MKCLPCDGTPNKWKLLCDEEQAEQLREAAIPGLFVWRNNKGAWGEVSAVAAGARLLGDKVPSLSVPMMAFHHGSALRNYQEHGVSQLLYIMRRSGCALLADDMGLGKTREAIVAASQYPGRKLVVCPAAVRLTWLKELTNLHNNHGACNNPPSVAVVDPAEHAKLKKGKAACSDATWVITSYDLARKVYDFAFPDEAPAVLIMDEAHNLRGRGRDGRGNVRTKGLSEIAVLTPKKLAITGTPLWDKPRDLWMLFQLMGITTWKRWDFDVRYCAGRLNQWGGMDNDGASNTDELKTRLQYYMVRRTKEEVASELPSLTRTVEWLDPVKEATMAWHHSIVTPSPGALAVALQATHAHKLARAVELATQAKRFVLGTYLREHAVALTMEIEAEGTECVCITGADTPKTRNALVQKAIERKCGVVCTIDSMGVGVDGLQHVADYGILHAIPWEPNKILQLEARLHRIGQQNHVQWTYLAVRESADEHVVRTVVDKLAHWQQVMGMDAASKGVRDSLSDSKSEEAERLVMRELYDTLEVGT